MQTGDIFKKKNEGFDSLLCSFFSLLLSVAVLWGSLNVCFPLFGFSSIAGPFPQLSPLHPSFFPSASFFPWRLLVFPHYRGLPMATSHCSSLWGIRCVCTSNWVCIRFCCCCCYCLAGWLTLLSGLFWFFPHVSRCIYQRFENKSLVSDKHHPLTKSIQLCVI